MPRAHLWISFVNPKTMVMNKQICVFAIVMVFGLMNSYGQVEEGNKLIGGSLSFNVLTETTKGADNIDIRENKYSNTRFSVTPAVGYFLSDHWVVGLKAGYGLDQSVSEIKYKSHVNISERKFTETTHNYQAGPFGRYYFDLGKGFYVFGEAGIDGHYSSINTKYNNASDQGDHSVTSINGQIQPGLTFFVNDQIGLFLNTAPLIEYHYRFTERAYKNKEQEISRTNEFKQSKWDTNFNLAHLITPGNLSIGVNVYLD